MTPAAAPGPQRTPARRKARQLARHLRGERPVHREELPPGTHTLRFERPGFVSLDTTLTLRSGTNVLEIAMRRTR